MLMVVKKDGSEGESERNEGFNINKENRKQKNSGADGVKEGREESKGRKNVC